MKNVLTEQLITNFKKRFAMDKEEAKKQGIRGEDRHAFVKRSRNRVVITPRIHEEYLPQFVINDVDVFEKSLEKYLEVVKCTNIRSTKIDDRHTEKYFLFNVWKNATVSDFLNPEKFISRYTDFMRDQTFSEFDEVTPIGRFGKNMVMAQRCQDDYGFETPYIMHLSLTDGKHIYNLPWIRYGITQNRFGDKLAYIYAIQRMEPSKDEEYNESVRKSINAVNSGVKQYRNVTPSAIAALGIFMGMLEAEKVRVIKAPDLLLGRYGRFVNVEPERMDQVQENLTEKFLRNFLRLDYQLKNFRVEPIDVNEMNSFLCMSLDTFEGCDNMALGQLYQIGRHGVERTKNDEMKIYVTRKSRRGEKFEDLQR